MIEGILKVPEESYFMTGSSWKNPIINTSRIHEEVPIFLYDRRGDFAEELFDFLTKNNPASIIYYDISENRERVFVIDEYNKFILKEYYIEVTPSYSNRKPFKIFYSQMTRIECFSIKTGRVIF